MCLCAKANGEVEDLQVYEPRRQERHLDLQKYSWNTPASTDLAPGKVGEIAPLSRSVSLPCAYFTHTAPGVSRRLDPSVRADDGTPAAELRSATLGASLLDEIIQKIISSLLSLLHFPKKKKKRLRKSVSRIEVSIRPLQNHSKKVSFSFAHQQLSYPTNRRLLLQRSHASHLRPYLCWISTPCMDHFTLPSARVKKRKWR